jgi:hypothetical protein
MFTTATGEISVVLFTGRDIYISAGIRDTDAFSFTRSGVVV